MTAGGFLGELWVTLGVDASGLNKATAAMVAFQASAQRNIANINATAAAAGGAISTFGNTAARSVQVAGTRMKQAADDYQIFGKTQKEILERSAAYESQFIQKVSKTSGTLRSVTDQLERTSNQFQRFGSAASRYLTLPIALVGAVSVKVASDLEFVSQKIIALANISEEQMSAWQTSILQLSTATTVSAKQIGETLYYVASAGIRSKEAMEIATIAAKAQASGMGKTEEVARMLTYAINAYGKENLTASQAADALTVAIREGTAEAGSLVAVIGDVIPIAATMGVSFDQVVGSLAAMTRTGFNAHKAATALRQIMVSLLNPTTEAENAMKKWAKQLGDSSISAEGFRQTIKDKGLIEALMKVDQLTETFGETASGIVFGNVRALTGHLSLVGKNLSENLEILRKTKEEVGAFEKVFERMAKTAQFKLGEVKNAINQAFLGMGQAILPTLLPMLDSLILMIKDITTWFKNLSESSKETVTKFGLFLLTIGPIGMAVAGLIKIFSGLRVVLIAVGTTLKSFFVFMGTTPWFAAAVGVAAVTFALYELLKATEKVNYAQEVANKVSREVNASLVNERIEIEQLMRMAQSDIATKKMKEGAIAKLNAISPTYLGFINEETIKTGEAVNAVERYIKTLENKARAQAVSDEMVNVEKRRVQLTMDPTSANIPWKNLDDKLFSILLSDKKALLDISKEYVDEEMKGLNEQIKMLQEIWDGTNAQIALEEKRIEKAKEFRIILNGIGDALIAWDTPDDPFSDMEKINDSWRKATLEALIYHDVINDILADSAKYKPAPLPSELFVQIKQEQLKEIERLKAEADKKRADYLALSLDDKIKYWMDLMKEAIGADLSGLAAEYAALDRIKTKQQQLIDLAVARANFKLESKDYEITTTYTTKGNPNQVNLQVQMQLDTKQLKMYTDLMDKLTAAGKYSGEEIDDLANKIIDLNAAMVQNSYADALLKIGGAADVTKEKLSALEKEITDLQKLYGEAVKVGNTAGGDFVLANQLAQIVTLKKSEKATLDLADANTELQKSLMFIGVTEKALGAGYDSTSAKLQEQYRYLDTLNRSVTDAKWVGEDYSETQEKINRTAATIRILEEAKSYETLSYALMDAENKATLYGSTYDRITPQLNAYTQRLNDLNIQLQDVNISEQERIDILNKTRDVLTKVNYLEFAKILKQYTSALQDNNIQQAIQGNSFNKKVADIDTEIEKHTKLIKSLNETSKGYKAAYEAEIAILEKLRQQRKKAAFWDTNNQEIISGLGQITAALLEMGEAAESSRKLIAGMITTLGQLASGNYIGAAVSFMSSMINWVSDSKKEVQAYYDSIIKQQEDYNDLLREQLKLNAQNQGSMFNRDYQSELIANAGLFTSAVKIYIDGILALQEASFNWEQSATANTGKKKWWEKLRDGFMTAVTWGMYDEQVQQNDKEDFTVPLLEAYPDLISKAGIFNTALARTLIETEGITAETSQVLKNIVEWAEGGLEARKVMQGILYDLTGSFGTELQTSLVNAWIAGEDASTAFGNSVMSMLDQVMKKMLFTVVFGESLKKLEADMLASYGIGPNDAQGNPTIIIGPQVDFDVKDDWQKFWKENEGKVSEWNEGMKDWNDFQKTMGFGGDMIQGFGSGKGTLSSNLFDSATIAQTIFDGIDQGLELGSKKITQFKEVWIQKPDSKEEGDMILSLEPYLVDRSVLGGFAESFGKLIKETIVKSITQGIEETITSGFIAKYTEFISAGSRGGVSITREELEDLEQWYISAVKTGQEELAKVKPLLDRLGISLIDEIKIFDAPSIAQIIFDGIDQGLKLGNKSWNEYREQWWKTDSLYLAAKDKPGFKDPGLEKITLNRSTLGGFAKAFGDLMKKTLIDSISGALEETITSGFIAKYAEFTSSTSKGGISITLEELEDLKQWFISAVKTGEASMETIKPLLESLGIATQDSLFDATSIAQTIFDGIDNGFKLAKDSLGDFSKGFGDLLKTTLMKSIMSAMTVKLTAGFISQFEEFMTEGSEGGVKLTAVEIARLQKTYGEAAVEGINAMAELNKILATAGIQTDNSNQMTKAVQGMTVEQAGLIAGQFTAMRYDLKDVTSTLARIASITVESNAKFSSNFDTLNFTLKENGAMQATSFGNMSVSMKLTNELLARIAAVNLETNSETGTQVISMTQAVVGSNVILLDKIIGMQYDSKENSDVLRKISSVSTDSNDVLWNSLSHLRDISSNTKSTADTLLEVKEAVKETNRLIGNL